MGIPRSFNRQTVLASLTLARLTPKATQSAVHLPSNSVAYSNANDPLCDRKPFVWTRRSGFTILPENGLEGTYNTSSVQDVSDDGRVAVGQLSTCEVTPDSPPQLGFYGPPIRGLYSLMISWQRTDSPTLDYYLATDVSRDGNRVLVVGNPPLRDAQDTPDLTLDLAWLGQFQHIDGLDGLSSLHRLILADHTL